VKLIFSCLVSALVSFVAGAWILICQNPEVEFWLAIEGKRDAELESLRVSRPEYPCIIFSGGSSCAFSIQPSIVESVVGLPTFNYGSVAGAGAKYIIHQSLERCRKGDILVLALEPHFLVQANRGKPTQLGVALAVANGNSQLAVGGETFGASLSPIQGFTFLRPGPRYTATWIGKGLRGDMSYRYSVKDYRPAGWLETNFRGGFLNPSGKLPPQQLSNEGRQLLNSARTSADERGVRVYYSLPWLLTNESIAKKNRDSNSYLLGSIAEIMPVLKDPTMGAQTNHLYYSDTEYHLNSIGSELRSKIVAEAIKIEVLK